MALWDDVFGGIFLDEEEYERSKAADEKLAEINRQRLEQGKITEEQYYLTESRIQEHTMENLLSNPETSIFEGFKEGAIEGAENVANFAGKGFSLVPKQAWLLGGAVLIGLYLLKKR